MTTILQVMTALPSLIKTIIELMRLAEDAFGSGKGAEKKQTVMDALAEIVNNMEVLSKVQNLFSGIINMAALFNFGSTGKEPAISSGKLPVK